MDDKVNYMQQKEKLKKKIGIILFIVVTIIQVVVLCYYGGLKSGFHEDELYSFFSSNRTAGLYQPDREWVTGESIKNELVVLKGEGFQYGLVKTVQSWDVHPPLYYFVLHTACSLFPGVFSKWLGIIPNILFFVLSAIALYGLSVCCFSKIEHRKNDAWLVAAGICLIWGFGPAVISGVMFIRMYQMLTFFVLSLSWLHVNAMKKEKLSLKSFYLPLMVIVYLGFLTQYYYIIFHIFMGAFFCIWLLGKKRFRETIQYAVSCAISLGLAILTYPASMAHIFRGYRGTEAVKEFTTSGNTVERISFFYDLINNYVFQGTLSIWLLVLLLTLLAAGYKKKREGVGFFSYVLLTITVFGYFITISKTALLLGNTSNRYMLPIYGLIVLIIVSGVLWSFEEILKKMELNSARRMMIIYAGVIILLFLCDIKGLSQSKVFFLYEEETNMENYVEENKETPVVVLYNGDSPQNVSWLVDRLSSYEKVFMVNMANSDELKDDTLKNAEKIIVYAASDENREDFVNQILLQGDNLKEYKKIGEKGLFDIYEMN